jgi:glycine cleavage system H protein
MTMEIPEGLRYTKEHEWVRVEGGEAVMGITDYAQGELGDIVFVDLPAAGRSLRQMEPFGTIEAVKAVSDLFSPITGEVVAVNESLRDDPGAVNKTPYTDGWMVRAKIANASELEALMSAAQYRAFLGV